MRTNTDLRKLFIEGTSKSIIVIEDIDCSLDLTGKRKKKKKQAAAEGDGESGKDGGGKELAALYPAGCLAAQLAGAFVAPESPVWMDSSSATQCREVEAAMGGPLRLATLKGC